MTPLQILQDIITIAKAIHKQVEAAKNVHAKLKELTCTTIPLLITSTEGLSTLPDNQRFIQSLKELHIRIANTQVLVEKIMKMSLMSRFFYAHTNEGEINDCQQRITEFIPLLTLGLHVLQVMNREKDRQDAALNQQALFAQMEQALRDGQAAARMDQRELDAIILKQLASVRHRFERLAAPQAAPVSPVLPKELIVNLYDIVFEQKIEEGEFGSIYQGTWQGQPVTIKCFDHMATAQERAQLTREAQVMSRLHFGAITHFYGACLDPVRMCLLMSIMEKGNLQTALASLSLTDRLSMAKDLAQGLAYLHAQNIIHGDIHPKHIGVNQHNQAKWTDFGLVRVRAAGIATLPRVSQEAAWQAPESWQNRAALTPASDVYSFGMLLWTLITGRLPYADISIFDVMQLVQRGERETIPSYVPRECRDLIEACWAKDIAKRPTASEIAEVLKTLPLTKPVVTLPRAISPTGQEYYERGVASERTGNIAEAYQDYKRSYKKDFFKAYTRIGLFALQGDGGAIVDKQKAQVCFEHAAAHGHADAMFNLGRMFEKGYITTGVQDDAIALSWYEKALKANPERARYQEKVATLRARMRSSEMNTVTQRCFK